LHDKFHELALRDSLQKGDLAREPRDSILLDDLQFHRFARGLRDFAVEFVADAVQNGGVFALSQAQNVERVVRLTLGEC
jgi:hypothetical protein